MQGVIKSVSSRNIDKHYEELFACYDANRPRFDDFLSFDGALSEATVQEIRGLYDTTIQMLHQGGELCRGAPVIERRSLLYGLSDRTEYRNSVATGKTREARKNEIIENLDRVGAKLKGFEVAHHPRIAIAGASSGGADAQAAMQPYLLRRDGQAQADGVHAVEGLEPSEPLRHAKYR
ncbi:MAG: hypothetical protein V4490_06935 [Pseudomonadota bacterium]